MADRGITFSAEMVRALLDERKTQTRRLLSTQPVWEPEKFDSFTFAAGWTVDKLGLSRWQDKDEFRQHLLSLVPHQPGDRLYVREHWKAAVGNDGVAPRDLDPLSSVHYLADGSERGKYRITTPLGRHRQAMHMPRWASRLTLIVTDVRVQQLREISNEDAFAEGCDRLDLPDDAPLPADCAVNNTYRVGYAALWDSLHTDAGTRWEDNPWIYAVTFDVRRGNIDQLGTQ